MNVKEHLQFLAMMVPTLLLLAALLISLAYPAQGTEADTQRPAFSEVVATAQVFFADDGDGAPSGAAAPR